MAWVPAVVADQSVNGGLGPKFVSELPPDVSLQWKEP